MTTPQTPGSFGESSISREPPIPRESLIPCEPAVPGESTIPREPLIPRDLLEFIREGEKFLIASHKEPDGDCVGSQLALSSALQRMGKEVIICSAGPFKRSEVKQYEHCYNPVPADTSGMRVILLDCTDIGRTGALEAGLKGLPLALIDHHKAEKDPDVPETLPGPLYIDDKAQSTTLLILKLINALGLEPTAEEAELLFLGLCTDTGFFRYVDRMGADAFEAAALLVRLGADPKAAFAAIHGGKSLESRILLGRILTRAESFFGGKLLYSCEEYEETCRFGLEGRDSDNLYQLLQSVAGIEAIVIVRQETPEYCSVGLRSLDRVDVGNIAASFGGGGHKNAAGFRISGTIAEIKQELLKAFEIIFGN